MGTPDFAVVCLKKLLASPFRILAVVTTPDRPKGRGQQVLPSAVKKTAVENDIEVLQPELLDDPLFIKRLRELNADLFVVVAFRILPPEVFSIPVKGTINVHASLLPKYRGAAPINWAIINGDKETGVTTMFIEKMVDAGKILLQERADITEDMTAGELHDKLADLGAELLLKTIVLLQSRSVQAVPQIEALISRAPKIKKEHCHLNFNQNAREVCSWIHGLSPAPAAYCIHRDKILHIFKARVVNGSTQKIAPGVVSSVDKNSFRIACADGEIEILDVQLQGKKRMSVRDFLPGYSIAVGDAIF